MARQPQPQPVPRWKDIIFPPGPEKDGTCSSHCLHCKYTLVLAPSVGWRLLHRFMLHFPRIWGFFGGRRLQSCSQPSYGGCSADAASTSCGCELTTELTTPFVVPFTQPNYCAFARLLLCVVQIAGLQSRKKYFRKQFAFEYLCLLSHRRC